MSEVGICTVGARCEKHGRRLDGFPCPECSQEWRDSHPNTSAAIARIARGKTANMAAARAADAALSPAPSSSPVPPAPGGGGE